MLVFHNTIGFDNNTIFYGNIVPFPALQNLNKELMIC